MVNGKYISLLLLFLLCKLVSYAQPYDRQGKDFALFFAVSGYDEWTPLAGPVSNAMDIADILKNDYGFETEVVKNPTQNEILDKINEYRNKRVSENSQLMIFFSGHGSHDINDIGYFVPQDGELNDPHGQSSISYLTLDRKIDNLKFDHILVVIDACYSGSFLKNYFGTKSNFRKRVGESFIKQRQRFIKEAYYNDENLVRKTRLVYTSGGIEKTPDPSEFAKGFVEGLNNGGNKYGIITFSYLYANFLETKFPKPRVGKFGSHETGDFLFINSNIPIPLDTTQIEENMILIKGGEYKMGDLFGKEKNPQRKDERPVHDVFVGDFVISKLEVSNVDFVTFLNDISDKLDVSSEGKLKYKGHVIFDLQCTNCKVSIERISNNSGKFEVAKGFERHPIVLVSWYGAIYYCNWYSKKNGLNPVYKINQNGVVADWEVNGFRLPTEAEWEYAAKGGGKDIQFAWGNEYKPFANIADEERNNLSEDDIINYWKNYNDGYSTTSPVSTFAQGEFRINNMTGNVWEWCWDWYNASYYGRSINSQNPKNPKGPNKGNEKSLRGSSWNSAPGTQRVSKRFKASPNQCSNSIGFRMVRIN